MPSLHAMQSIAESVENLMSKDMARYRDLVASDATKKAKGKGPTTLHLRESQHQYNQDARRSLTRSLIAEYDLMTCTDPDVEAKTLAYYASLSQLDFALKKSVDALAYDMSINQTANKIELTEKTRAINKAASRRSVAQQSLKGEEEAKEADVMHSKNYAEDTQRLMKLRSEYNSIDMSEIRQIIVGLPDLTGSGSGSDSGNEDDNGIVRRERNVSKKKNVKGIVKRNLREIQKNKNKNKKKLGVADEVAHVAPIVAPIVEPVAPAESVAPTEPTVDLAAEVAKPVADDAVVPEVDENVKVVKVIMKKKREPRRNGSANAPNANANANAPNASNDLESLE